MPIPLKPTLVHILVMFPLNHQWIIQIFLLIFVFYDCKYFYDYFIAGSIMMEVLYYLYIMIQETVIPVANLQYVPWILPPYYILMRFIYNILFLFKYLWERQRDMKAPVVFPLASQVTVCLDLIVGYGKAFVVARLLFLIRVRICILHWISGSSLNPPVGSTAFSRCLFLLHKQRWN